MPAPEQTPEPRSEIRSADRIAGGIFAHLAKVAEIIGGLLFGFALDEPKLTRQQAHDAAQAAGNVETQHAALPPRHRKTSFCANGKRTTSIPPVAVRQDKTLGVERRLERLMPRPGGVAGASAAQKSPPGGKAPWPCPESCAAI